MAELLLHVGMGKAAASFLQEWFAAQPEILSLRHTTPLCDLICDAALESMNADSPSALSLEGLLEELRGLLDGFPQIPVLSEERFSTWQGHCLERSEDFDLTRYRHAACYILKEIFPDALILIITRNPQDWLRSSYSQYASSGGCKSLRRRLRDQQWFFQLAPRFDLVAQLYGEAFGPERVQLVPFELLQDDPNGFIREIGAFVGVKNIRETPLRPANPSLGTIELKVLRYISRLLARSLADDSQFSEYRKVLRRAVSACASSEDPVVRAMLRRLARHSKVETREVPSDYLETMRGKFSRIADNPLYLSYASRYLL